MTATDRRRPGDDEAETVLLLSTPDLRDEEVERLRTLAPSAMDWPRVIGLLVFHRTVATAWRNIVDTGLLSESILRPSFILRDLQLLVSAQRLAVGEQMERTAAVAAGLDAVGVSYAVLKGAALARMAYRDIGSRMFNDNDILVPRDRLADVAVVLKGLGYLQGHYEPRTGTIAPASRSEVLLRPTTSHEVYPYALALPDAPISVAHTVDVHFSVDLMTSLRRDDVVRDLLSRRIDLEIGSERRLSTLHQEDMFIFACTHFQREACNRREVETLKDLLLYKLVDLVALLSNTEYPIQPATLAQRAMELGFAREVYFALRHIAELFPGRVPAGLLDAVRPESDAYIDQLTFNGEPFHTWRSSIQERFFNPLRVRELDGVSP